MGKVKFGLKNVHIAPMDENENYLKVFKQEGGVSLNLDAEGDSSDFYADDKKYFSTFVNNGYSGELEIAKLTEEFLTEVMGQTKDEQGGITENINDKSKYFALMFEVDGDVSATRYIFYKCKASRPSIEAETKGESAEPKTDKLELTTTANNNGDVRSSLEDSEETKENYEKFFETVYGKKASAI